MKVLDLFSGIGGFALATEAAGGQTVAFAETDPYCSRVLAERWPGVPNLGDVRGIDGKDWAGAIDVVVGGFPCQDISAAGRGAGLGGARSGLWFDLLRIIRGARPAFCLIENSPALRLRGADVVLDGLEEAGYAARAFVVGAWAAGAPHRRDRVWIVANAHGDRCDPRGLYAGPRGSGEAAAVPLRPGQALSDQDGQHGHLVGHGPGTMGRRFGSAPQLCRHGGWIAEPDLDRVANGVSARAHRLRALGNAIVPQVAVPFLRWIAGARVCPEREPPPAPGRWP